MVLLVKLSVMVPRIWERASSSGNVMLVLVGVFGLAPTLSSDGSFLVVFPSDEEDILWRNSASASPELAISITCPPSPTSIIPPQKVNKEWISARLRLATPAMLSLRASIILYYADVGRSDLVPLLGDWSCLDWVDFSLEQNIGYGDLVVLQSLP